MKKPGKTDIALYIAVIMLAIGLLLPSLTKKSSGYVIISTEDGLYRYSLKTDRTLSFSGPLGETEVVIKDGEARITASPCPNQTCVREGSVKKAGDMSVCLPNRVTLRAEGESDVAAVSR